MQLNRFNLSSFKGGRYINAVVDVADNSILKAFEKNKEMDMFLARTRNSTESNIDKRNMEVKSLWGAICKLVKPQQK